MSEKYQVRALGAEQYAEWDRFVKWSPQGTLFHTSDWLERSGDQFAIYGCYKGNELRGGLAIGTFGPKFSGHPRVTPYLGLVLPPREGKYVTTLSNEKEIVLVLARHLKTETRKVTCRFSPEVVDLQPFIWEGYSTSVRYTYRLNVGNLDAVWENMDSTRRKNIRRAQQDGITIEHGAPFGDLFSMVESTYKRQNRDVRFRDAAFRYNEMLTSANKCRAFVARSKAGQCLAAVYIVWDEKRTYYLLGGHHDSEGSHHSAGALAMWEAIRFTAEKLKLPEFDFEGSTIPAVERFFRKFGGILTPTYRVTWDGRSHNSAADDSGTS